jgi:hypothetical protein
MWRYFFFDRRVAQYFGVAKLDQHRAFGVVGVIAGDVDWTQLVGLAVAASYKTCNYGCHVELSGK